MNNGVPLGGGQVGASAPQSEPSLPPSSAGALLIVDSDPLLADLLRELVEIRGYRVLTVHSAEKALELYAAHPQTISLVIADLEIPSMGAVAMVDMLRLCDPQARVLILSCEGEQEAEETLRQRGVRGILRKPFSPHRFVETIQELLAAP